jgi:hypothetical protein
MDMDH